MDDKRVDIYMEVLSNAIKDSMGDSRIDRGIMEKNAENLLALALQGKLDKSEIINMLGWK